MEERLSAAGGALAAELRHGVARVTLSRPEALNALTLEMLVGLGEWLEAWRGDERVRVVVLRGAGDRAFCAGGDVRALREAVLGGGDPGRFFEHEYRLDHRIHTYPKPVVAVMDGIAMGGGMGLAQGAALRIVGDRTRLAMPETAIGLFPDVGGSWFLPRLPGRLGMYLGLTGVAIGAADAIYAGLACAYLAPSALDGLDAMLERAAAAPDPASAVRHLLPEADPGMLPGGELAAMRPAIDRHFGAPSVPAMVASLEREDAPGLREWARRTLARLAASSPTMLEVTHEQLRRGSRLPLADCFRMELGLVHGCFEQGDFLEGVRAALVDKDRNPRWNPPTLAEVRPEAVAAFFRERWSPAAHPLADL